MWKSRFEPAARRRLLRGARDTVLAASILSSALYLAFESRDASRSGRAVLAAMLGSLALILAAGAAITIVPRLARRVDWSAFRLPFSFRFTREGAFYIASIFLLSLAAINSGNNLLFIVLALQLSAIVTSGIFARASLEGVTVSLDVPENVFVGEAVSIRVQLRNRKPFLPSLSLTVEDASAPKSGRRRKLAAAGDDAAAGPASARPIMHGAAFFPILLPGQARSELLLQSFPARGRYRLQGFQVSTRFPFGLFERGERVRAEGEILVYPEIQEVSSYFHLLPFQPGRFEGRHVGRGDSLHSIRRYQDGESARFIDWKATAKAGRPMSRAFARDEELRLCLILDTIIAIPAPGAGAAQFERAVSLAASLASHFTEEGAEIEFLTPDEHVPRGLGLDQLYRILRSLAVVEPRPAPVPPAPEIHHELQGILGAEPLGEILSGKVFKIIITSKPRGGFPSALWRSSHVIYFDEL